MVKVVLTSPRVAPDLLTAAAWKAIRDADRVVTADLDDPLVAAVRAAGVVVSRLPKISGRSRSLTVLAPYGDETAAAELANQFGAEGNPVDVLVGSHDLPGARLLDLVAVMARLRTDCPWDRQQTHESLARYLLEEAYETLEAIETGDHTHLREELGDLLLQIVFHARLASEHAEQPWDIDDVATGIFAKLVRRHPHVFAGLAVEDAAEVESNWEDLKAAEKQRESVLSGVPPTLPALALAAKLLSRAARAGLADVDVAPGEGAAGALGDQLFAFVGQAHTAGVDPEQALRDATRRFAAAVHAAETG